MCLGIPGQIVAIDDAATKLATVDRSPASGARSTSPASSMTRTRRGVCRRLGAGACRLRDGRIDEAEAAETLQRPRRVGEAQAELDAMAATRGGVRHVERRDLATLYPFLHGKAPGRSRSSTQRSLASVADKGARLAATPARASSPSRARRCSPPPQRLAERLSQRRPALHDGQWRVELRRRAYRGRVPAPGDRRPARPRRRSTSTADVAMLSAIGNDRRLRARLRPPDRRAGAARATRLIGVSTSGNSANLLAAFAKAKEIGIATIGLAGGDGGRMRTSRHGRSLPRGAVDLDPPHPGMPRRRLSHPVGPGAHAARRRSRLRGRRARRMKYVDEFRDRATAER